jgi:predicted RNase H-like HicB family nuclease
LPNRAGLNSERSMCGGKYTILRQLNVPGSLGVIGSDGARDPEENMRNEFMAIVERDKRWYIAYCPEIPGANGQGRTKSAALKSLTAAIALILEDRRKDGLRGIPANAAREKVIVG